MDSFYSPYINNNTSGQSNNAFLVQDSLSACLPTIYMPVSSIKVVYEYSQWAGLSGINFSKEDTVALQGYINDINNNTFDWSSNIIYVSFKSDTNMYWVRYNYVQFYAAVSAGLSAVPVIVVNSIYDDIYNRVLEPGAAETITLFNKNTASNNFNIQHIIPPPSNSTRRYVSN